MRVTMRALSLCGLAQMIEVGSGEMATPCIRRTVVIQDLVLPTGKSPFIMPTSHHWPFVGDRSIT
jgi:hypothetical protein